MPQNASFSSSQAMPSFLKTEARSLSQEAYLRIKRLILSGTFKDGEKIPEERIAQILNVSRTPIREALRQLGQYGLVDIKPRSYARVASVTLKEAEQIARVRLELEKLAARSFVHNASDEDIDALESIADQIMEYLHQNKLAEVFELDSTFHLEMVRRSDNAVLYDILERLDAKNQLIRMRLFASRSSDDVDSLFRQHQLLVEKSRQRDEDGLMRIIEMHITPGT